MLFSPLFESQKRAGAGKVQKVGFLSFRERESSFSLNFRRSDRRFSTEQEAKSIYAARATLGHQFGGVLTTPRGRDLFLLVLFFG